MEGGGRLSLNMIRQERMFSKFRDRRKGKGRGEFEYDGAWNDV